jgi:hypothetical protein
MPNSEQELTNPLKISDAKLLFERIEDMAGIRLTPQAQQELSDDPFSFEFVESDVLELQVRFFFFFLLAQEVIRIVDSSSAQDQAHELHRSL